jgi:hypothetical protein
MTAYPDGGGIIKNSQAMAARLEGLVGLSRSAHSGADASATDFVILRNWRRISGLEMA